MVKTKAQTQDLDAGCRICGEPIANPICPFCLEKEIEQWLLTRDFEFLPVLREVSHFFASELKKTRCVVCRAWTGVCPHCYINEVYNLLLLKDIGLAQELITAFDFDWRFIEAS